MTGNSQKRSCVSLVERKRRKMNLAEVDMMLMKSTYSTSLSLSVCPACWIYYWASGDYILRLLFQYTVCIMLVETLLPFITGTARTRNNFSKSYIPSVQVWRICLHITNQPVFWSANVNPQSSTNTFCVLISFTSDAWHFSRSEEKCNAVRISCFVSTVSLQSRLFFL